MIKHCPPAPRRTLFIHARAKNASSTRSFLLHTVHKASRHAGSGLPVGKTHSSTSIFVHKTASARGRHLALPHSANNTYCVQRRDHALHLQPKTTCTFSVSSAPKGTLHRDAQKTSSQQHCALTRLSQGSIQTGLCIKELQKEKSAMHDAKAALATFPVTLHRYAPAQEEGDLTIRDLAILWGLLCDEDIAHILFHDGSIQTLTDFIDYATSPCNWFYAARHKGEFIGIGILNGFSHSGNTAFGHLASFACGRDGSFAEAGRQWFRLLANHGGIDTLIAVLPGCYRGARRFISSFGFIHKMTLPGAMRLHRKTRSRITSACVYKKQLRPAAIAPHSAGQPQGE